MSITEKTWKLYIGGSWIGTLIPTGSDDDWYYAEFEEGNAWGNFAPWFEQALEAQQNEDEAALETVYSQLALMGLSMVADDGEKHVDPTILIDGSDAWFVV